MRHARRLPKVSSQDHSTIALLGIGIMGCLVDGGYEPHRTIGKIFVLDELADLRWKPNVAMGKLTKRIEEHLGTSPWRCGRREVEQLFAVDGAEAAIDVGLVRELLLQETNPEPPEGTLQGFDLSRELHPLRVDPGPERRNLVDVESELIRWCGLDSPSKTVDRRG